MKQYGQNFIQAMLGISDITVSAGQRRQDSFEGCGGWKAEARYHLEVGAVSVVQQSPKELILFDARM